MTHDEIPMTREFPMPNREKKYEPQNRRDVSKH